MRSRMRSFPGSSWASLSPDPPLPGRTWWKLTRLEQWVVESNQVADAACDPRVGSVVWLDDDLRHGARRGACERRFDQLGVEVLMVAPRTPVAVTPRQMLEVGEWVKRRIAKTDRHLLDVPWRTSPVAPCGCYWDGLHCPHCTMVTDTSGDGWHPGHTIRCHQGRDAVGGRRSGPGSGGPG
eukprot:gene37313-42257_t